MPHDWQVQQAKSDLSAIIRAAEAEGPQTITRHGQPVAVVVSQREYAELSRSARARQGSLVSFFADWPALELERDRRDYGREIDI